MRKPIAITGALVLAGAGFLPISSVPALAATSGTLTVVSSGGANEGTGWTYSSGLIELSANTSINSSDIEAKLALGDLTLYADAIQVNDDLSFGTNNLTLKATESIQIPGGVTVTSTGGDVTLQADSDDSGAGHIKLGTLATDNGGITTGGGDIVLSGGSNPLVGYAMATSSQETGKPSAGVAFYGVDINAGGGDLLVRGGSGAHTSYSTREVMFELTTASGTTTMRTSGLGTVTIVGDGSSIAAGNPWGITISGLGITTGSGDVSLSGKANTGATNARGVVAGGLVIDSTSGNVLIEDTTDGSGANYSGTYLSGGGASISTAGAATIRADKYVSDGTLSVNAASLNIESYTTNSFQAATSFGALDSTGTDIVTLGNAANTANLVVSGAITTDETVVLNSSGSITDTSAKIEAANLRFGSTGAVTLTNAANDVDVISGGTSGSPLINITFVDEDDLEIGSLGSVGGIYAGGVINISTTSGDLSINQAVSTTSTSTDSLLLYADKDATSGSAGDGDIVFGPSGSIAIDSSARARLYSGSRASSTGLVDAVGGDENVRASVASTTSLGSISPALGSTGAYALFRTNSTSAPEAPSGAIATSEAGSYSVNLSWSAPTNTGGSTITGYKIEMNDGSGWVTQTVDTGTAATSAVISGLTLGTTYEFRVSAINAVGTSSASAASSALTIAASPTPTPYSGPIIANLAEEPVKAAAGGQIVVEGIRLELITKISVDGKELVLVSRTKDTIVYQLPELTTGIKDLIVEWGSALLTHQDALSVQTAAGSERAVNAGSFKGYVALYAKGYQGSRLSAKVGNDWVIVPSIPAAPNNLYRHVDFTGAGVDCKVRIYIDRVLIRTIELTTR